MSLVTPAQLQALGIGLALSDTALQSAIDLEEAEIVRRFGANYADAPISETVHGGCASIFLKRAIETVASVSEYLYLGDTAPLSLDSTYYHVWADEGRMTRIYGYGFGTGVWGPFVTVSYTPVDDTNLRTQVLTELVRISTEQSASGSGSSEGVSGLGFSISASRNATGSSFAAQRADQYARLGWLSR